MRRKLLITSCAVFAIGIVTPAFASGTSNTSFFATADGGTSVTSFASDSGSSLSSFQPSSRPITRSGGSIGSDAVLAPDASTLSLVFGALPAMGLLAARRRKSA